MTNHIFFTQYVAEVLDKEGHVGVVYTDIAKAFHRLDHDILLKKLARYDLSNSFLKLLNDHSLCPIGVTALLEDLRSLRCSQGSNLGPVLFVEFINDLSRSLRCRTLLFADDVKIFSTASNNDDCRFLLENVNLTSEWNMTSKLPLCI